MGELLNQVASGQCFGHSMAQLPWCLAPGVAIEFDALRVLAMAAVDPAALLARLMLAGEQGRHGLPTRITEMMGLANYGSWPTSTEGIARRACLLAGASDHDPRGEEGERIVYTITPPTIRDVDALEWHRRPTVTVTVVFHRGESWADDDWCEITSVTTS